jgi:nitric oxide reductase subunit C
MRFSDNTVKRLESRWRKILLLVLWGVYLSVSIVAYTDFPRQQSSRPLTELERQGLAVWRHHNCQVCHQIFGFGGFLGPDLTNFVDNKKSDGEFTSILTYGLGRMPALNLTSADQRAVLAYLRRINWTGRSQPRPLRSRRTVDPIENFRLISEEWARRNGSELPPKTRDGSELWSRLGCGDCHMPFVPGRNRAPDLSGRAINRSVPALRDILDRGRGRMPSYRLTRGEIEKLGAYLEWISSHRADLVNLNNRIMDREEFSWRTVPWFEYQ